MVDEQKVIALIRDESVMIDRGAIGELYETALKFLGIGIGGVMYTAGKKGGARGAQLIHNRIGLEGDDLLQAPTPDAEVVHRIDVFGRQHPYQERRESALTIAEQLFKRGAIVIVFR